jgi:cytoskeletal protein RodZ
VTHGGPGPTAEDLAAEALQAFGRHLRRERELRGLSPDEVARATKLAPGVIESLESGDPGRLPPRAYLHGCLRSYATAVGLDPDEVLLRFQEARGPAEAGPATAQGGGGGPRRRTRRAWVAAAALLVALALAALAAWRSTRGPGEVRGRRSAERAPYQAPAPP